MNVYNEAHNLARAIRESEEFKQYDAIKKQVAGKPELQGMLSDFQAKQFEMQAKQMMGESPAEDLAAHIQELYHIMMKDPVSAQYLQCEIRFSMMMSDVYKILGEVMGLGHPGLANNE
ncbi:MAG: YlbF family regulator [Clostridiales bacterium]|nr:YlbF family regulator [Clostridiales bacterium]